MAKRIETICVSILFSENVVPKNAGVNTVTCVLMFSLHLPMTFHMFADDF